ncbi:FAD-binding domain-containing protein [Methylobacillus flagellatus]|uniref:FAD-binding domain-containing protein n=1 Tax=Methylobacillus flagellatus TaxID=405 RepID=UPI0010F5A283|nr:FAD-binding domain-containing protein [Methylobacillus flagellatus]
MATPLTLPHDHQERLALIRQTFPDATGPDLADHWRGGRLAALSTLATVDGIAYGRSRNFLDGAVTRLSPYLRHGCITLNEAIKAVQLKHGARAEKLLFEFAWRDYWRQVWTMQGDAIRSDMESPKVAVGRAPLPADVLAGETGLPCMDAFVSDLVNDGYVHNHARMWFAAYLLHWRKVDWRAAADWYEAQLLDGDIASNSLSWQWVASTFGAKPYYFNKENLEKYSAGRYCQDCTAQCPFDDSYEALNQRLFSPPRAPARQYAVKALPAMSTPAGSKTTVLVHDEMLSPLHPLLAEAEHAVFIFDPALHGHWALHRLQFMADCLSEMEQVSVWVGDTRAVLSALDIGGIVTQASPNRDLQRLLAKFAVHWVAEEPIAEVELRASDLKRFSRYWQKVGPQLLGDSDYRKP